MTLQRGRSFKKQQTLVTRARSTGRERAASAMRYLFSFSFASSLSLFLFLFLSLSFPLLSLISRGHFAIFSFVRLKAIVSILRRINITRLVFLLLFFFFHFVFFYFVSFLFFIDARPSVGPSAFIVMS